MKNLFVLFFLAAFTFTATAQDPGKDFKSAEKMIKKFISDPSDASVDVGEAVALMKSAVSSDKLSGDAKYWVNQGKMLNDIANAEFKSKTINPEYAIQYPTSAADAYNAFASAKSLGDKKKTKDITYGLEDTEGHLNNFAIFAYQAQDYKSAFTNFEASIQAAETLKSLGKDSRLDEGELMKDQYYFTAISAYYSEQKDAAMPYLEKLYSDGASEPFIYEALYNINAESDADKAVAYLDKGIELNPDDTGLLFAQINHYLKEGKLDELIGKLETAIEKEPDNMSIYNTLGSVYDQLHAKYMKEGDDAKATQYFDSALKNFNAVLDSNPNDFDATYSVGALYYNKAATYVDKLNSLTSDLSKAGMKKYDETKAEMDGIFKQALPFFQKAEGLNGNDMNTLIALKEIHARLNDIESSNAYKAKIEAAGN